jgi:hypothetical protein
VERHAVSTPQAPLRELDPLTKRARALERSELETRGQFIRGVLEPGRELRVQPVDSNPHKAYSAKVRREIEHSVSIGSVGSPLARRVLEAAYARACRYDLEVPHVRGEWNFIGAARGWNAEAGIYQQWIAERLPASGLAQRLPDGLAGLPDITAGMAEPWRTIERLLRPRNHVQLVGHLVQHLDWYFNPTQPVKPPLKVFATALSIALAATAVFALRRFDVPVLFVYFCFFAIPALSWSLLGWLWGRQQIAGQVLHRFNRVRELIHAVELYYYLAAEYVEPPEPDGAISKP